MEIYHKFSMICTVVATSQYPPSVDNKFPVPQISTDDVNLKTYTVVQQLHVSNTVVFSATSLTNNSNRSVGAEQWPVSPWRSHLKFTRMINSQYSQISPTQRVSLVERGVNTKCKGI